MNFGRSGILGLLLTTATALQGADAPRDGVAKSNAEALRATLKELRETRFAHETKLHAAREAIDVAHRSAQRLAAEVADVAADEAKLDVELAGLTSECESLRTTAAGDDAAAAALTHALDDATAAAELRVRDGLDFKRDERLARLAQLAADPTAGADSPARRLARFANFLEQELRIARSSELYSATIALAPGRAKPARIFRVGLLLQGFVTEDDAEAGLEEASGFSIATTPELAAAARRAVAILERQRAPELVTLPVGREARR